MNSRAPSRRETLKPLEFLGGAGIAATFVGVVVLMVTRDPVLAGISFGIVFIVVLVALAMFVLTIKPNAEESADIGEQNRDDDRL